MKESKITSKNEALRRAIRIKGIKMYPVNNGFVYIPTSRGDAYYIFDAVDRRGNRYAVKCGLKYKFDYSKVENTPQNLLLGMEKYNLDDPIYDNFDKSKLSVYTNQHVKAEEYGRGFYECNLNHVIELKVKN